MQETWVRFLGWEDPPPPGEGNGNQLQYSCLGNSMDRGVWQVTGHGVTKRVRHNLATKPQTTDTVRHITKPLTLCVLTETNAGSTIHYSISQMRKQRSLSKITQLAKVKESN